MKLLIDAQGGMAGDMFSAALISAGADFKNLQEVMLTAGRELGSVRIDFNTTPDGASQLDIKLDSKRHHLGSHKAMEILTRLFDQFYIQEKYRTLGLNILDILVKAEKKAHRDFNIIIASDHSHHHAHENKGQDHKPDHNHHQSHDHHQGHQNSPAEETFLHEAQDIIIDIMGAAAGMQMLDIESAAELLTPVSVGGGHVHFSHGTLPVPAPATAIILAQYGINWKKGPIEKELFTPTGAAILAALGSRINENVVINNLPVKAVGISRGAKILPIPPLKLLLY